MAKAIKKKANKVGRPTVMTEKTLDLLKQAYLMGCTDEEACLNADISPDALYKYQRENPEYIKQKQAWKQRPFLIARKQLIDGMIEGGFDEALKYMKNKKSEEFNEKNTTDLTNNGKAFNLVLGGYGDKSDNTGS